MYDINSISSVQNVSYADKFQILRLVDNILLSYKSRTSCLTSFYVTIDVRNKMYSILNDIDQTVASLSTNFITKKEIDSTYATKDNLTNVIPSLLTNSTMNSILENYVSTNDVKTKSAQAREYAFKLGEEMTDLATAALVGAYQSKMAAMPTSSDTGED